MRALSLVIAALALVLAPGPVAHADDPPHAEARWKRVAAALARDPLFVDMDLADTIDTAGRARIKAAMTRTSENIGVPVFVVVVPNDRNSESYGRDRVFLAGLRARLDRDGLYVMVDGDGSIEAVPFGVPRRLSSYGLVPSAVRDSGDYREPFARITDRLTLLLDLVRASPQAAPTTPAISESVPPFGEETSRKPLEAAFWGPFTFGLLLAGPALAGILYGTFALVSRARRRPWRELRQSRPSVRGLVSLADEELKELARVLDPDRPATMRAYDAARLLRDEVGPRPARRDADAALDLVGVVVLARQGRAALTEDRPAPPCYANPLHGPAGRKRRRFPGKGSLRVCDGCVAVPLKARTLRVPDGRAHYDVPGRWQRGGFGSRRPDIPSDVLESLGVD
ncbi:hypothetical protein GCM10023085_02500 [Actinomadura viridis]|uniref:DUF4350 domain-containing protein n=1 Tax=Actinomadura viridis TaxID=58110 RepID=A0A931GSP6_9ACTN|nr:hypothetical protein [Actinomadura viridis]MBG6091069.1 hypothetical protein [Actinomadura viridis]